MHPRVHPEVLKKGQLKNVSKGGIFIETTRSYPLKTIVEIVFNLPDEDRKMIMYGIVRWKEPAGMGLEFFNTFSSAQKVLGKDIEEQPQ